MSRSIAMVATSTLKQLAVAAILAAPITLGTSVTPNARTAHELDPRGTDVVEEQWERSFPQSHEQLEIRRFLSSIFGPETVEQKRLKMQKKMMKERTRRERKMEKDLEAIFKRKTREIRRLNTEMAKQAQAGADGGPAAFKRAQLLLKTITEMYRKEEEAVRAEFSTWIKNSEAAQTYSIDE